MPGAVRPVSDELDGLLAYLEQQRHALRITVHGLTQEQATSTPTKSALNVIGLIKHGAVMEKNWINGIMLQQPYDFDYEESFQLVGDETIESVLAFSEEVGRETDEIMRNLEGGLDRPVPVPQDVPWFPKDVEAWSARWVLLHLIEELARHGGHADIVREHVDGGNFYELMYAAEGIVPSWA